MGRYRIRVKGIVQGVGFRPFIYQLSQSFNVKGWVKNTGADVVIDIECNPQTLELYVEKIKEEAPLLSSIKEIEIEEKTYIGYGLFEIQQSLEEESKSVYISPDVSVCDDCLDELYSMADHRYHYPFINCTNCGPRFTIVKDMPYDRVNTTMDIFPMCARCEAEYNQPLNRRYHAQPIACPECGPKVTLLDAKGNRIQCDKPIPYVQDLIKKGKILAVKGLGGYHLACHAHDPRAVKVMRNRKGREGKPFALMVRDLGTASRYCYVSKEEERLLASRQKPIVLLKKKPGCGLPEEIAPGISEIGVMLPYTPLHYLLFYPFNPAEGKIEGVDSLVMTSGNRSQEPIYYTEDEALRHLKDIADFFLVHDRPIHTRADDSVTRILMGKEFIIRRSRGYVPTPVTANLESMGGKIPSVLACGGELKNTFCINKGKEFYLSHHIGDLENAETLASFEDGISHFKNLFEVNVEAVAYDLHPEYLSTQYALSLGLKEQFAVQHHHAHIASCMAENHLTGSVIGVAFDGTGYGEDHHLWGGEFFTGGYMGFARVAHLDYRKMPGGSMAVKEPWRMAISYLYAMDKSLIGLLVEGSYQRQDSNLKYMEGLDQDKAHVVLQMMEKGINSPMTSSAGRFFDAVSALLGIRTRIHYEGQAAIELESMARKGDFGGYPFSVVEQGTLFRINTDDVIFGILEDIHKNQPKEIIASKFHETAANIVLRVCEKIREVSGLSQVVLSGGVFQNMILLKKCCYKLREAGFSLYTHHKVPSNDGGISLGQATIACVRKQGGVF